MIKLATPISTLFADAACAQSIAAASDCLECRDQSVDSAFPRQELFHFEADLVHPWSQDRRTEICEAVRGKPELALVTFHVASCCSAPVLESHAYRPGGVRFTSRQMREAARENVAWLRSALPANVTIGVENNNYYPTPAYDTVTDGAFLTQLAEENDLRFLLDIAHARITAHNRHLPHDAYLASLPLDRLAQIHVSGSTVQGDLALDTHLAPGAEELAEVQMLIARFPSIRYFTIEYYRDAATLLQLLSDYRRVFSQT